MHAHVDTHTPHTDVFFNYTFSACRAGNIWVLCLDVYVFAVLGLNSGHQVF